MALTAASKDSIVTFGPRFLVSTDWNPTEDHESYGAAALIFGTLVTSGLALMIAVPISLGIAIFLAELAPDWLRGPLSFIVELLAAVPSVIYGLWGLFVLRPIIPKSIFLASVVLAIMVLPTISSVTREVLRAVPNTQREGALALGATRWEMVRRAVLPSARSGIVGAIILGLGRALGETMAVTMLIGNSEAIPSSIFKQGATITSKIANGYDSAADLRLSALMEAGLILFFMTFSLNLLARLLVKRVGRVAEGARA